ncbi:MAG: murein hydrolase activator EnvC family protein [Alphaproteobacteria bacterium]
MLLGLAALVSMAPAMAQDYTEQPEPVLTQSLAAAAEARAASEERAESITREATAAAERLAALRQELVIAAYAVQDAETVVAALERRIEATRSEHAALAPQLAETQARLFQSVLALHAVARDHPLARLVAREDPNAVLRAGVVMSALAPQLQDQAETTAGRLGALRRLELDLAGQLAEVAAARDELAAERHRLTGLHEQVDAVYASQSAALAEERARAEALAQEVESLAGLVAALRRAAAEAPQVTIEIAALDAAAEPAAQAASASRSGVPVDAFVAPARGRIVGRFGETTAGIRASGIRLEVAAGAQVVSPFAGHVAYAGDFPGRGLVLIIEHGGGYHSVLTELARIDTAVGRQLLAGEPVGVLAGDGEAAGSDSGDSIGRASSGGTASARLAELYYELRRDGAPIDPMPWFSTVSDGIDQ